MANTILTFNHDGTDWVIEGKKAKEHKLSFPARSGKQKISLQIGTPTGRFTFDTADPIWVQEGTDCPQSRSSHPDVSVAKADPGRLVIDNANEAEATLCYQLNVIETATGRSMPIDPIIQNGGNGKI